MTSTTKTQTKTGASKTQTKTSASKSQSNTGASKSQTGTAAQPGVRTLVRDGAYALLGVGDVAVGALRAAPARAQKLRTEAPKAAQAVPGRARELVTTAPTQARDRLEAAGRSAGRQLDGFTRRGRSVVESIGAATPTRRAFTQVDNARTQVKAATTSLRRAVGRSVTAVAGAADQVGGERE